jgi:hypothetical protein
MIINARQNNITMMTLYNIEVKISVLISKKKKRTNIEMPTTAKKNYCNCHRMRSTKFQISHNFYKMKQYCSKKPIEPNAEKEI